MTSQAKLDTKQTLTVLTFKVIVVWPTNELVVVHKIKLVAGIEGPGTDDAHETVHVKNVAPGSSHDLKKK